MKTTLKITKAIPGFYIHVKTGNVYSVSKRIPDCTNGERDGSMMVVYNSMDTGESYTRLESEFLEKFEFIPTVIISAFPGTGKSHYTRENPELCSDSDSSGFSWTSPGVRNPEFPSNYMDHIKGLIKEGEKGLIFVSSHAEVRSALEAAGMHFSLVYPTDDQANDYLERYIQRGSPQAFLDRVVPNFKQWVNDLKFQNNCSHRVLKPGETITSFLNVEA